MLASTNPYKAPSDRPAEKPVGPRGWSSSIVAGTASFGVAYYLCLVVLIFVQFGWGGQWQSITSASALAAVATAVVTYSVIGADRIGATATRPRFWHISSGLMALVATLGLGVLTGWRDILLSLLMSLFGESRIVLTVRVCIISAIATAIVSVSVRLILSRGKSSRSTSADIT